MNNHSALLLLSSARYPLGAVLLGGILGWVAGKCPRGPDPLIALSPRGAALLGELLWFVLGLTGAFVAIGVLFGVAGQRGFRRRLVGAWCGALFGTLLVLVGVGCPLSVCLALAVLSLWAGMGMGAYLGALLGAMSTALAISLGALFLPYLGRPAGRWIVNKKREAMAHGEEDS